MHLLCLTAVGIAALALTLAQTEVENDRTSTRSRRKFPEDYPAKEGCFARSHVQLEGRHLFQRPLAVMTSDECCDACRDRGNCVGWVFKGCCDYCFLYSEVTEMRSCSTSDCVGGIVKEEYRHVEDAFWDATPRERFRGLIITCEQRERYASTSAVLSACGKVLRSCAPSQTKEKRKSLEPVEQTCYTIEKFNYWGSDYNNGFTERELTADDCCHECLRDRGCRAWTKTAGGQCFKKWRVPPKEDWIADTPGSFAGTKIDWNVSCSERMEGVAYDIGNPDEKHESTFDSADACCQKCSEEPNCLIWSFIDGHLCRELRSYGARSERNSDAVSAYMVTKPPECDKKRFEDSAQPLQIAQAHHPRCASVLVHGPGEERRTCADRDEANRIFIQEVKRLRLHF